MQNARGDREPVLVGKGTRRMAHLVACGVSSEVNQVEFSATAQWRHQQSPCHTQPPSRFISPARSACRQRDMVKRSFAARREVFPRRRPLAGLLKRTPPHPASPR